MTHIAQQRIKRRGKIFAPGDKLTLSAAEFADLPEGAALPDVGAEVPQDETSLEPLSDAQRADLGTAVAKLKDTAFKQDGDIRAGALKHLNQTLGFAVSVADVAAALKAQEA
jgi:hypothetical protein